MLSIDNAKYLGKHIINITFNTKEEGIIDFSEILKNEKRKVFKPLKDINILKNFIVDYTLTWNNGEIDMAPEFLYFQVFKNNPQLQESFKKWGYIT